MPDLTFFGLGEYDIASRRIVRNAVVPRVLLEQCPSPSPGRGHRRVLDGVWMRRREQIDDHRAERVALLGEFVDARKDVAGGVHVGEHAHQLITLLAGWHVGDHVAQRLIENADAGDQRERRGRIERSHEVPVLDPDRSLRAGWSKAERRIVERRRPDGAARAVTSVEGAA